MCIRYFIKQLISPNDNYGGDLREKEKNIVDRGGITDLRAIGIEWVLEVLEFPPDWWAPTKTTHHTISNHKKRRKPCKFDFP